MGLGLLNEMELQSSASEKEDYNLIRRLQGELGVSIYYNTITLDIIWIFIPQDAPCIQD